MEALGEGAVPYERGTPVACGVAEQTCRQTHTGTPTRDLLLLFFFITLEPRVE